MVLLPGNTVPTFSAVMDDGQPYTPRAGRWQVVFFFPKAATTHCQLQARRYQALYAEFQALGVDVVGVNSDPRRALVKFRDVCRLDYPLLLDEQRRLSQQFGVQDEQWPDEPVRRVRRETFLMDPEGVVRHHWTAVEPGNDAQIVLDEVRRLLS
jgi:peroxiredoxin Q/BCP